MAELHNNYKLAVGLSREHALNNPRISRSDLVCFPMASNIYTYSVIMQTRQDFYLLEHINTFIDRFVEHGMIANWDKRYQNNSWIRVHVGGDAMPQALTVNHILGAILILGVGLSLAILEFFVEFFVGTKLQALRKKWRC